MPSSYFKGTPLSLSQGGAIAGSAESSEARVLQCCVVLWYPPAQEPDNMGDRVMDVVAGLVKRRGSYHVSGFQQGGLRSFCVGEELVTGKGGRRTSKRRKGLLIWLVGAWILVLHLMHCNFPSYVGALEFDRFAQSDNSQEKMTKQDTEGLRDLLIGAVLPVLGKSVSGFTYTPLPFEWTLQKENDILARIHANMKYFQNHIRSAFDVALSRTQETAMLSLYVGKDYLILFAKRRILTQKSLGTRTFRRTASFLSIRDEEDTVPHTLLTHIDTSQQMLQATTINKCTLVYVVVLKAKDLNNKFVRENIYERIPKLLLQTDVQHDTCAKVPVSQELISQLLPGVISLHDLP